MVEQADFSQSEVSACFQSTERLLQQDKRTVLLSSAIHTSPVSIRSYLNVTLK